MNIQQLAERNIELQSDIKHKRNKKKQKTQNSKVPYKNKHTTQMNLKKNIKQHYLNSINRVPLSLSQSLICELDLQRKFK